MPHTNSMCDVFGTHQSKCKTLNLWTKKTRLNSDAEPWFHPERHLPGLLSGDIVPHTGSAMACSQLTGLLRLNPLMHGSHLCSALEGQWSMQSQKQLLQFCFEGIACSPCITDLCESVCSLGRVEVKPTLIKVPATHSVLAQTCCGWEDSVARIQAGSCPAMPG